MPYYRTIMVFGKNVQEDILFGGKALATLTVEQRHVHGHWHVSYQSKGLGGLANERVGGQNPPKIVCLL